MWTGVAAEEVRHAPVGGHEVTLTRCVCVSLAALAVAIRAGAQSAADLRTFFFQRDFEGGYHAGLAAAGARPTPEWRAWFVANEARYGLTDEALAGADSIAPGSPWRVFARVVALSETPDRFSAVPLALSLAVAHPRQPDFLWSYAYALMNTGQYTAAAAALDSGRSRGVRETAELRAYEGDVLAVAALNSKNDSNARPRARAAFAAAKRLDSTNVDSYYLAGILLANDPADSAAADLARAVELSPFAPSIHAAYWDALLRRRDRPDDSARAEIARDIAVILRGRGNYPGALYLAARGYRTIDSAARQQQLEDRILGEYDASPEVDRVLMDRIGALSDSIAQHTVPDSSAAAHRYRIRLTELIGRLKPRDHETLASAYVMLFTSESNDSTVSDAELVRTIRGLVRTDAYNPWVTHVLAPVALADRRIALRYAERLARQGESVFRRYIAHFYTSTDARQRARTLAMDLGGQRDALGWVYLREGRVADAARTLAESRALDLANPAVYYHLGQLSEELGRLDSAQGRYATGYQLELTRIPVGDRNGDALRRLYRVRHGADDGFDAYIDTLRVQDRRRRQSAITASRAVHPIPLPRFTLHPLGEGSPVASAALRGKIVVLHFWGMWCGPCVAEMPDFERWYESVRGDTDIVVLTIDYNDADRRAVARFVETTHLLVPVLLDDDYVDRARVHLFPTTWFLDRAGRIVFKREGWKPQLGEEFGWRVDMLRR
jgi:thiol-disulfide isomerase/thioredoxin